MISNLDGLLNACDRHGVEAGVYVLGTTVIHKAKWDKSLISTEAPKSVAISSLAVQFPQHCQTGFVIFFGYLDRVAAHDVINNPYKGSSTTLCRLAMPQCPVPLDPYMIGVTLVVLLV